MASTWLNLRKYSVMRMTQKQSTWQRPVERWVKPDPRSINFIAFDLARWPLGHIWILCKMHIPCTSELIIHHWQTPTVIIVTDAPFMELSNPHSLQPGTKVVVFRPEQWILPKLDLQNFKFSRCCLCFFICSSLAKLSEQVHSTSEINGAAQFWHTKIVIKSRKTKNCNFNTGISRLTAVHNSESFS